MKKFALCLVSFILIFALCSCSKNPAKDTVEGMLSALSACDFEKAKNYVDTQDITNYSEDYIINAFLENMSYEILNVKKDGKNFVVSAKITTINSREFIKKYVQKTMAVLQTNFSKKFTAEELKNIVNEITKDNPQKSENEASILVKAQDGAYKALCNDELLGALFDHYKETYDEIIKEMEQGVVLEN